jgi:hypothetical protein
MKIEHGIPIPPKRGQCARYVAMAMAPGDSVFFETEDKANTLRQWLREFGGKPIVRKMDGGWRVWRTAGEAQKLRAVK